MKALSVHPYWAMMLVSGNKKIEVRTWQTSYRGTILICATNKKVHGLIPGHALGTVDLIDVVPLKKDMLEQAMLEPADYEPGLYAWIVENPRFIKPIPLRGKLSLWEYTGDIEYLPEAKTDEEDKALFNQYWKDLIW